MEVKAKSRNLFYPSHAEGPSLRILFNIVLQHLDLWMYPHCFTNQQRAYSFGCIPETCRVWYYTFVKLDNVTSISRESPLSPIHDYAPQFTIVVACAPYDNTYLSNVIGTFYHISTLRFLDCTWYYYVLRLFTLCKRWERVSFTSLFVHCGKDEKDPLLTLYFMYIL